MTTLDSLYTVDAHEEGAWLDVLDPRTGEKHGLRLHLVGEDSDTYAQARADAIDRRMKNKSEKLSVSELRDETVEIVVACTKGWDGVDEKFTRAAARELYRKSPPVFEQVDKFIHSRSEFYRD